MCKYSKKKFPPPCPQGHYALGGVDEPLHLLLVSAELVPHGLHLLEEPLPLVQLELGLGEVGVEAVLALTHPSLGGGALREEALGDEIG